MRNFTKLGIIMLMVLLPVSAGAAENQPVQQEIITRGAILEEYQVPTAKGSARVFVTKIDLQDPYLKINSVFGKDELLGANQTVQSMAEASGAVAAINGGFFDMAGGTPLGPIYEDGDWITTPSAITGLSSFAITRNGEPMILPLSFQGSIITESGASFSVASLNKTISLADKLNVFDAHWNLANWPVGKMADYVAVVVDDGEVEQILFSEKPAEIPQDGYILLGNGLAAQFILANIAEGEQLDFQYEVTPGNKWDFVIGGHTPLVLDGERAVFTRTSPGYNARTAVGYTADKSTLAWFVVEFGQGSSGMTLEELAAFMISLGMDQGINFDGGGSATLISRHPGETSLAMVNSPQAGAVRKVPDGLALYSTAPTGDLKDLFVGMTPFILVGESTELSLKAVDEYDNPLDLTETKVRWSGGDASIAVDDAIISGQLPGIGIVRLKAMGVEKEYPIEVVGRDSIQSLNFNLASLLLQPDEQTSLKPTITTKSGKTRTISPDLLQWQWLGVNGSSSKGSLQAGEKPGSGWLVGTYDQFSAMVPVQVGVVTKALLNFEKKPVLNFTGLPQATSGSFTLSQDSQKDGSYSGKLAYDFSQTTGDTEIAYGEFGLEGITFPGPAGGISLWVKGDGSGHWLRAEIKDAAGKIQYLTLAKKIDWIGWQQVSADFTGELNTPVLKRIYLVNQGLAGGDNLTGSILIDQLEYKTWQLASGKKDVSLKLLVNQKTMFVDGLATTIDQGPLIEKGRSYIPARSIVEALGGKVFWNSTDKMVRVIAGTKMIDLWIDDKVHTIVNGTNSPQESAPIIRNGRTLVPVRLVTESLGYKVEWNQGQISVH